jgi:hypothetical protein
LPLDLGYNVFGTCERCGVRFEVIVVRTNRLRGRGVYSSHEVIPYDRAHADQVRLGQKLPEFAPGPRPALLAFGDAQRKLIAAAPSLQNPNPQLHWVDIRGVGHHSCG